MTLAQVDFRYFLDRPEIQRRIASKNRRILGKSGAFGRKVIRNNIRRRKSVSKRGGYPHAHVSGNTGMKLILFSVDPNREEVIIGPLFFRARTRRDFIRGRKSVQRSTKTVPQLLNEGGYAARRTTYLSGQTVRQRIRYAARPFRELARPIIVRFFRETMRTESL